MEHKGNEIEDILNEGGDIILFPEALISEPQQSAPSAIPSSEDTPSASPSSEDTPSAIPSSEDTPSASPSSVDAASRAFPDSQTTPESANSADNSDNSENSDSADKSRQRSSGIKNMNPEDMPREKALRLGMNALTDVELLAILLGSGIRGKSVFEFSREILNDCNNRLATLARMEVSELMRKYKGLGLAKATLLRAAMTFGQRAQADLKVPEQRITGSDSVYELMRDKLERNNHEEFWLLHLSRANRVMLAEQLSKGGTSSTVVDVKLIVKSAIDHLSSGIIVCHNHPSGNMTPSIQDDKLTHNIIEACKFCDIKVIDHVIIGPTGYYSYQDNGRLR